MLGARPSVRHPRAADRAGYRVRCLTAPNNEVYRYWWFNYRISPPQTTLLLLGLPTAAAVTLALWLGDRLDAAVHEAMCVVIDDICKSQGIAPLSELARRPAHRDLSARIDGPRHADTRGERGTRGGPLEPVN